MEKNKHIDYYNCLEFFKKNNKNDKLKLTKNNAIFIETVLKIDSGYKDASNPTKYPSKEYIDYLKTKDINKYDNKIHNYGSGQYWINNLVKIINSNNINFIIEDKIEYEKKSSNTEENENKDYSLDMQTVIKGAVCAIDRENATHLTAHVSKNKSGRSNGRSNVAQIIYEEMKKGLNEFKKKLIKKDDFSLIGLLTVPKNEDSENYHYSFATKFCKYLCLGFGKEIDKYYIYDNIIISNINYYIENYGLNKNEYNMKLIKFEKEKYINDTKENQYINISEQYKKLWNCLELIRNIANKDEIELITRNELDHIIWYSNK